MAVALAEIGRFKLALNVLEDTMGRRRSSLSALLGFTDEEAGTGELAATVKFDEFYHIAPLDAAKRYLRKCKDARPFKEIVAAIKQGGGRVDSEEELRTGLTRSTFDVVKISDRFGAIENYPHVKRGKKRKGVSLSPADAVSDEGEEGATETKRPASSRLETKTRWPLAVWPRGGCANLGALVNARIFRAWLLAPLRAAPPMDRLAL